MAKIEDVYDELASLIFKGAYLPDANPELQAMASVLAHGMRINFPDQEKVHVQMEELKRQMADPFWKMDVDAVVKQLSGKPAFPKH